MKGYKVEFKDNKAISAYKLHDSHPSELVKLIRNGNKRTMEWLVVFSLDEQKAIQQANDMIKGYWVSIPE